LSAPSIIPHPEYPDCVAVVATSSAHAWRIMNACDVAGFRAGLPSLHEPVTVAVTGHVDDPHIARLADVVRGVSS
jgi:hypothetical protein